MARILSEFFASLLHCARKDGGGRVPWEICMRGVCWLVLGLALAAPAGQAAEKRPPAPPVAAAPPPVLPDPPTPVTEALGVGLGQCAPILDKMGRETLTAAYGVQSSWSREQPERHVFQSVAVLNSPGNVPPDGFAALVAAPLAGGGCDGVALQVFPLAGDCQAAQKILLAGGKTIGEILNARIMLDAAGKRLFLLPGFNKTCIAIAVDSSFGVP